ncbi:MAG: dockerin type I repeat-containing protein, partial [Clostridia bacterium]|nr:dockerin type I repeat-containing protein [Clostridia bacterium]
MKKILSFAIAVIMLMSTLALSASAAGSLIFKDDFEMGFKPLNWVQGAACEFKWNKEDQCLIGYESAVVLQPNFGSRDPKMWGPSYMSYDFQVRDFDDIDDSRETHEVGIWYRDLFENDPDKGSAQLGAVYTMFITIETGRVTINKSHTFQYRDENNILKDGKIETVLVETYLPGSDSLEEGEYAIEVAEDAPWHEIGVRVTSGKLEWYYDRQLIATTEADPTDEKLGEFALNSVDATVGSQRSPLLFWNLGNYIAVDNFEVWSADFDFVETTYGDVNGDTKINLADASLLLKKIAKWDVTLDETAADVNGDTKINLADASLLLKKIAKWDV